MRLTLLGTGNAAGMPLYGCQCQYCTLASANIELQRTACSASIEIGEHQFLIDAGQLNLTMRYPAGSLSGIFLTHFHPDHVQGLFHLRWGTGLEIPVFTPPDTEGCADLFKHPGILNFKELQAFNSFALSGITVTPLPLLHSKPTFGYAFEHQDKRIAYLTDTKGLPQETTQWLMKHPLELLIIDCSYVPGSNKKGHNNLDDVLSIIDEISPKKTCLTHIGHDLDIWLKQPGNQLPPGVIAGYDNQQVYPFDGTD